MPSGVRKQQYEHWYIDNDTCIVVYNIKVTAWPTDFAATAVQLMQQDFLAVEATYGTDTIQVVFRKSRYTVLTASDYLRRAGVDPRKYVIRAYKELKEQALE
jgi:hypothetical protein